MSSAMQPGADSRHTSHHADDFGLATRAIHHGFNPATFSNAVQPPVFLTSTDGFESVAAAALGGKLYAREHNLATEILTRARQPMRRDTHLAKGVGDDLIHLSVGLEDPEDIIADLRQAVEAS